MSDTDDLRAELDALRERVRELESAHTLPDGTPPTGEVRASRRQALRLATGAAVGAIGAAAVTRPVAADDPNDVTLGSVKSTASRPTGVRYTGNASGLGSLFAAGAGASGNSAEFSAALGAWSHSDTMPNGLYGFAEQPGAAGVVGKNEAGDGGVGVRAIGKNYGLYAETRNDDGSDNWGVVGVGEDAGVLGEGLISGVEGTGDIVGVRGIATGNGVVAGVAGEGMYGGYFVGGVIGSYAQGELYGLEVAGEIADLHLMGLTPSPPGVVAGPQRRARELTADENDELWFCVAEGAPGTWRKLSGPATAGAFHPIGPFRVYDSRLTAFTPSGPMAANDARTVSVADGYDIDGNVTDVDIVPAGATAVALNVTVTETGAANFLSVTPGGAAGFQSSTINWWQSGLTLANGTTVPLGTDRDLRVWAGPGGPTHFLIDVAGYWR